MHNIIIACTYVQIVDSQMGCDNNIYTHNAKLKVPLQRKNL